MGTLIQHQSNGCVAILIGVVCVGQNLQKVLVGVFLTHTHTFNDNCYQYFDANGTDTHLSMFLVSFAFRHFMFMKYELIITFN